MVAKTFQRQNAHPHPVAQQAPARANVVITAKGRFAIPATRLF
jgi:hypothetical protein